MKKAKLITSSAVAIGFGHGRQLFLPLRIQKKKQFIAKLKTNGSEKTTVVSRTSYQ